MITADGKHEARLLVRHDVRHQFRIGRHLTGGYGRRMLGKELVVFGKPEGGQCHVSTVRVEIGGGVCLRLKSQCRNRKGGLRNESHSKQGLLTDEA